MSATGRVTTKGCARDSTAATLSLSRSDGEPAQAPPAYGGALITETAVSQRRTHRSITVGAGRQTVQDTIGSTADGGSRTDRAYRDAARAAATASSRELTPRA